MVSGKGRVGDLTVQVPRRHCTVVGGSSEWVGKGAGTNLVCSLQLGLQVGLLSKQGHRLVVRVVPGLSTQGCLDLRV
jgi:hypothetical protein